MANGRLTLGKQSGGTLGLVFPDGVSNTEVVLPESGELVTTNNIRGFKNYIINGNFDIWQRGTSIDLLSGEIRCADMFLAYNPTTAATASKDLAATGFYSSLKLSGANSIHNKHILYRMEAVDSISLGRGGNTKITFSLWLKADVNSTVRVGIRIPNTSDVWSSYTTPKTSNDILITTSWDRYSVTFDLDFVYWEGIALDVYTTTAQTSLWTTGWQLEKGSIATPFENRPYGLELSLCQRYYEANIKCGYVGAPLVNGASYGGTFTMSTKRVQPTFTLASNQNHSAFPLGIPSIDEITLRGFRAYKNSTVAGSQAYWSVLVNASAEL